MSDDHTSGPSDNWRRKIGAPQPGDSAIGRIAGYILEDIWYGYVDECGGLDILVDEDWRPNQWAPRGYDLRHYQQKYDRNPPLDRQFHGLPEDEQDEHDQALTFWLTPEALKHNTPEALQQQVEDLGVAIALKHEIHPLEARIVFPHDAFIEEFGNRFCAGVALIATRKDAPKLAAAYRTIMRERTKAEVISNARAEGYMDGKTRPDWSFLGKSRDWASFTDGDAFRNARDILGVRQVMDCRAPELPMMPVTVTGNSVSFELTPRQALLLDGEEGKESFVVHPEGFNHPDPEASSSKGLAIWLDPSFFSSYLADLTDDLYDEDIHPKLLALCEVLSQRHGNIPITPHFLLMEGHMQRSHMIAPSVLVLTTDAEHEAGLQRNGAIYRDLLQLARTDCELPGEGGSGLDVRDRGRR